MTSQMIENHRENAEVYTGVEICKAKSLQLLGEISLPKGLLPLDDLTEVGYNRSSGFVWLRQKKKKEHYFKSIGKSVSYGTEVTAFVENYKMKKLSGVKSKEFLIWVGLSEICIDDPNNGKITFKTPSGLYKTFPVSAFEMEEDEEEKKKKKVEEKKETEEVRA